MTRSSLDRDWFQEPGARINIVDTTLRDGEQTAGVVFSNDEKLKIASYLDRIGVDQIEAGIPVMGGFEKDCIKQIVNMGLKASIMAWNRAVIADIKESLECGVDAVAISISTSDIHIQHKLQTTREDVLARMADAVKFAKDNNLYVSVNAEDASRSDMDFLTEFALVGKHAGADRLRFCDTVGTLTPLTTFRFIRTLVDAVGLDIEMHTHNDFGMAVANALSGIYAGANYVGVTVNGQGGLLTGRTTAKVASCYDHISGGHFGVELRIQVFHYIFGQFFHVQSFELMPAGNNVVGINIITKLVSLTM
jgi:homocitrate synthase NifV